MAGKVVETRRNFLHGAGVAGLWTGIGSAVSSLLHTGQAGALEGEADISQRERHVDEQVAGIRARLNSQDVRECLEGKGELLITRLLQALQMPIDQKFVRGTKYDASQERMRHCVQLAYSRGVNGRNDLTAVPARAGQFKYRQPPFGNAFYFRRADKLMTALHVLDDARGKPDAMEPVDISVVAVGDRTIALPDQVIEDPTSLSNADIHGAFVTIEGVDPDRTSTNGCKSYPGVAVRLQRAWVEQVFAGASPRRREQNSRAFLIVLPPGEAAGATHSDKPAAGGMSGAPVFMHRNGSKVLAGILYSVATASDAKTGRSYDLGFFQGIEEIREAYAGSL